MKKLVENEMQNLKKMPTTVWFSGLAALTVLLLTMMNLFAIRPIATSDGFLLSNAGMLLIAPVLVIQNVIVAVWGGKTAARVTIFAIVVQIFITLLIQVILLIPNLERGYEWDTVFGGSWVFISASIIAFIVGSVLNIFVFVKIKNSLNKKRETNLGKGWKVTYTIAAFLSTIIAQFIDSLIFFMLAFQVFAPIAFGVSLSTWAGMFQELGISTAFQVLLELSLVVLIASHLAKYLVRKKRQEENITGNRFNFSKAKPILNKEFNHTPIYIDLSETGEHIEAIKNLTQRQLDEYIKNIHKEKNVKWSISGEREERRELYKSFDLEKLFIHIGLDINIPSKTPLFAPFDCEVVKIDYDQREKGGGFGGNITLKVDGHGDLFYLVFGHLEKIINKKVGDKLTAGQQFAFVGDYNENGGWFEHVHMQVLTQKAYNENLIWGFVDPSLYPDLDQYSPSPLPIILSQFR